MLLCWFWDDAAPAGAEMKACSASLQKPAWAFWETSLAQICSLLLLAITTETSQDDQSYGNSTCQTWWKVCSSQNRRWNNPSLPNFLSRVQSRSEDLVCCRMTPRLTLLHWYNLEKAGGHSHQQPSPYFKLKPLCFWSISVPAATASGELPAGTRCTIKYFPAMACHYYTACTVQ